MQVFRLFMKIMRANIPSAMIYIIVFFSVAIPLSKLGASQESFVEKSLKVCIFDEDNTEASRELIDFISQSNEIITLENNNEKILDAMYYEAVDYTFTIKKGYEEQLVDLNNTGSLFQTYSMHQSYAVAMMDQMLDEYVRTVRAYVAGGNTTSDAIKKAEESVASSAEVTYEDFRDEGNGTKDYTEKASYFFRYLPYIFISIMINLLCPILLAFNRKDQRFRINSSCIRQSRLTGQLFIGSGIIVIAVWLLFMLGGLIVCGMYQGVGWISVLNSFIFAMISALIALLVASFKPSETVVSMITQVIGLGMCFLCGVFVPQSMLGDGVLAVAKFLPAYWFERVNDTLAGTNSFDLGEIWMGIGIEAGFMVLLALCVMLINFKKATGGRVKHVPVRE